MGKYGFKKAFVTDNIEFYGGSVANVARSFPFDLIINLSGDDKLFEPEADPVFANYNKVNEAADNTPRLDIDWPDYGLPKLSIAAWEGLAKDIFDYCSDKKKKYQVAVFCVGGHGRTGSALAILKCLMLHNPEKDKKVDPVESIRVSYDKDAVETYGQVSYVSFITGRKSKASGSKKVTTTSTSVGGGGYFAKPTEAEKAQAITEKQNVCKHLSDNVGTPLQGCADCDAFLKWRAQSKAEKAADKMAAEKKSDSVVINKRLVPVKGGYVELDKDEVINALLSGKDVGTLQPCHKQ